MKLVFCVSGIKYALSCEKDFRFPEMKEYLCGEEGSPAASGECGDTAGIASAGDCSGAVELTVTAEDIAAERAGDPSEAGERNLLKAAILRKVALESLKRDRMLVHGACIAYEGKGYLFTAPSGTGKTTHIRLWKKALGEEVTVVNGDKPILRFGQADTSGAPVSGRTSVSGGMSVSGGTAVSERTSVSGGTAEPGRSMDTLISVYGTPWAGKEGWQTNTCVPLAAVVEIVRGTENSIRKVDKVQAFTWLYQHSYLGEKDRETAMARMNMIRKLVEAVPVYVLECDVSEDAFGCSYRTLVGREPAEKEPEEKESAEKEPEEKESAEKEPEEREAEEREPAEDDEIL